MPAVICAEGSNAMASAGRRLLAVGSELVQQRPRSPGEALQLHAREFPHHLEAFQVSQALRVPLVCVIFAFFLPFKSRQNAHKTKK